MIILHHLNNSRSQRVIWLLEELGLEYDVRHYRRNADMSAPDELKRVHPLGKSPVIEDAGHGDTQPVLTETAAICEYLVAKADGQMGPPSGPTGLLRYRMFLHYAEGSVMPVLFALLAVSRVPLLGKVAAKRLRPMLDVHLDYIETELSTRPWFAGESISAADVMMSFPLEAAAVNARLSGSRPAITEWLKRIHARPAYIRALEKGGPYRFAQ